MSQQLQDLIEKIKKEGILEAQEQARGVEAQSRQKADEIIANAKTEAQQMIARAQSECQKLTDSTHIALKQASRDLLLNLRKEIEALLHKIVAHDVQKSLTPDHLAEIIHEVVSGYVKHSSPTPDISVIVSPQELKKLKDGFLSELKDKFKHPITLKSVKDIGAGFTISFDGEKSFFDFTDESLADYLSGYLNVELAKFLREAVKN